MTQYMKKLKTILQSNYFYILLIVITIFYSIYYINIKDHSSIYNTNSIEETFIISDYKYNGNLITLNLNNKENIIATYSTNNYEEYIYLKDNIKYGTSITANCLLKEPSNNTTPNTFNYKKYLYYKNIYYTCDITKYNINNRNIKPMYKIKNIINNRIIKIDKKGYIKALILGNKDNIEKNIYNNYQKCGISHLFAISGMHIGLISSIYLKIIKSNNKYFKYLLLDIILILYGIILGFPSSIKRCITFYILNSINKLLNLKINNLKIFIVTISIIILSNPFIIYDTGFQYSITTVFGIIYCGHLLTGNKIQKSLKLSIITFLFSLPITLHTFYTINILSIIYNIIYIPYISIIVYPLSLFTYIFDIFIPIFNTSINILEKTTTFLSNINILSINLDLNIYEIILFYIFLLLSFKYDYKLLLINIIIIIIDILIPYFDTSTYIYYFDVNQGDSSLIISENRKNIILIDTGGKIKYKQDDWKIKQEKNISEYYYNFMKSKNINRIDYLILSHGDYDHMGEAINIVNNIKVKNVIFNCGEYNDLEKELISVLEKKNIKYYSCIKELNIDNNKLYFLQTKEYDNENDNSSVIYTELSNHKFLFMGDSGLEVEDDLIKKYNLQDIDVLKVGHHGSKTSSGKEFINEINPKFSIISVGNNNRYGHPNKEVLNILDKSKIYRTDQDGSIMFKLKNDKLKIETCTP